MKSFLLNFVVAYMATILAIGTLAIATAQKWVTVDNISAPVAIALGTFGAVGTCIGVAIWLDPI